VVSALRDQKAVGLSVDSVHQPLLVVDAPGREAGQVAPQPLRLSDAAVGVVADDVANQKVDPTRAGAIARACQAGFGG
jgi:hypothetical protein